MYTDFIQRTDSRELMRAIANFVSVFVFLLVSGLQAASARSTFQSPSESTPAASAATQAAARLSSCEKPDAQLQQADALLQTGDVEPAEKLAREYLTQRPDSADAQFLLGRVLFEKIHAQANRRRGTAPDPQFVEQNAKASLVAFTEGAKRCTPSALELKIAALDYVLLGSYADADKWLTRSLAWNPADADAWYYLGRAKYNENRFLEAIAAFNKCLALSPGNVRAEDNLGLAYAGLGRNSEAVAAMRTAISWQTESGEKSPEPYIDLGDLLIQLGKPEEAAESLLPAVEIDPRNARAHEALGKAYSSLNQLAKAQAELEEALALAPENASLHYLLGQVYRKQGLLDKAQLEFSRFAALKSHLAVNTDPKR